MQTRTLGSTGFRIGEVGLGCWQFGGDFGPMSESRACEIIEAAVEEGVTFFDTADVYGAGKSETFLGNVLSQAPAEIRIATKYGRGPKTYPDGYSLQNLRDSVRFAQDRLKRDSIDLLQLHCVPPHVLKQGDIFDWLREIQREGLIQHFGASVETIDEAQLCIEQSDMASLQIIFNLLRQRPKTELFEQALQSDVGIIVRLPLASGVLTGKFTRETQFPASDHRQYNKNGEAFSVGETFAGIPFEKALELTQTLAKYKSNEVSMAQFALRWILDHPAVSTIIPGASSKAQVQANVSAASAPCVEQDIHQSLYEYYLAEIEPHIRCEL